MTKPNGRAGFISLLTSRTAGAVSVHLALIQQLRIAQTRPLGPTHAAVGLSIAFPILTLLPGHWSCLSKLMIATTSTMRKRALLFMRVEEVKRGR